MKVSALIHTALLSSLTHAYPASNSTSILEHDMRPEPISILEHDVRLNSTPTLEHDMRPESISSLEHDVRLNSTSILERGVHVEDLPPPDTAVYVVWVSNRAGASRALTIDKSVPMPKHSCPRDAIAALTLWREICTGLKKMRTACWDKAPSIEMCCGEWAAYDDPKVRTLGLVHNGKHEKIKDRNGRLITMITGPATTRDSGEDLEFKVIMPRWDHYNEKVFSCDAWRPQSDEDYMALLQNAYRHDLTDVNDRGEVLSAKGKVLGYMP